jgi:hypothetical protein
MHGFKSGLMWAVYVLVFELWERQGKGREGKGREGKEEFQTNYLNWQTPSWEADSRLVSQQIERLLCNRSFIAVVIRVCHWSLSWDNWIQSTHPTPPKSYFPMTHRTLFLQSVHSSHPSHLLTYDSPISFILDLIALIICGDVGLNDKEAYDL